jgi:hypothetical protein
VGFQPKRLARTIPRNQHAKLKVAETPLHQMSNTSPWFFRAVLSAVFAAIKAIFEWSGIAMIAGGVMVLAFK